MIRTLVALDGGLIRGSLAHVLAQERDIQVVGEPHRAQDLEPAVRAARPDVTIVDDGVVTAGCLVGLLVAAGTRGRGLVLVEPRRAALLRTAMARYPDQLGFLGRDVLPHRVVDAVRQLAEGEVVIDPDLLVAALGRCSPLTRREIQVLHVAADGCPVREIAARLALSPGTVRNYLSQVMAKAGARTRIDAVRIARECGWI